MYMLQAMCEIRQCTTMPETIRQCITLPDTTRQCNTMPKISRHCTTMPEMSTRFLHTLPEIVSSHLNGSVCRQWSAGRFNNAITMQIDSLHCDKKSNDTKFLAHCATKMPY